jgi:hypothetical protein
MIRIFRLPFLCLSLLLVMTHAGVARQQTVTVKSPAAEGGATPAAGGEAKDVPGVKKGPAAPATPQAPTECRLCRWFELQTATIGVRYRFVANSLGVTTNRQLQHTQAFKARFKFDRAGKYSINAGVFSGSNFTGSWNNLGPGTGRPFTNLYLKQLYFSAKPAAGLEVQYGGLYVSRGESTEVTSYDNDAYLMGERVSVRRPKELFFDEVSVTYAYLGDFNRPNINKRFSRLKESNYHQFLLSKRLGKRAVVSADYTFESGVETMREAVRADARKLRVVDSLRLELYQRLDVKPDAGFALSGEKSLFKRLTVGGG